MSTPDDVRRNRRRGLAAAVWAGVVVTAVVGYISTRLWLVTAVLIAVGILLLVRSRREG
jgi:hypothetical protein